MNIIPLDSRRATASTPMSAPVPAPAPAPRFGVEMLDLAITPATLHEVFAAAEGENWGAAGALALLLAYRGRTKADSPIFWVRGRDAVRGSGRLHAPGLAELGIDPALMMQAQLPDAVAVLRAGADIARSDAVGAMLIELHGNPRALDLTATRRLSLAAAQSGVLTLLLRIDAAPAPSAARSRWEVAPAPSRPLAANAPGPPCFDVTLLRLRGGPAGAHYRLEWDRDTQIFRETPLSGGMAAMAAERTDPPSWRHQG